MHPLCPLLCVDEIEKRRSFIPRRVFTADRASDTTSTEFVKRPVACWLAEFHYHGPNESSPLINDAVRFDPEESSISFPSSDRERERGSRIEDSRKYPSTFDRSDFVFSIAREILGDFNQ